MTCDEPSVTRWRKGKCRCDGCAELYRAWAIPRQLERQQHASTGGGDGMNDPREWTPAAACRPYRTDLWFPLEHDRDGRLEIDERAAALCASCPVQTECLDYALRHNVEGIWAGTTPRERKKLRRYAGIIAQSINIPDPAPTTTTADILEGDIAS